MKKLIIIIIASLLARICLFQLIGWTILGADVGRMAIVSHTWYLKGEITPDLRPYDMAENFFYFPGVILLPLAFEYLGVNPIDTIIIFTLLFSFLGTIVFYKISRFFLNTEQSISALILYSFAFDFILLFNLFGVYPYGFASFFFLLFVWFSCKLYFSKVSKKDYMILFLSLLGIFSFHWYLFIVAGLFMLSLFIHEFVEFGGIKNFIRLSIYSAICLGLILLLYYPYMSVFWKYKDVSDKSENAVDLLTFTISRAKFNPLQKFSTVFFMSYIGSMYSPVLMGGFVLTILLAREFVKDKKIVWLYFFILVSVSAFLIFFELNLLRISSFIWLVYSVILGFRLRIWHSIILILLLFLIQSPSIPYLMTLLYTYVPEIGKPSMIVPYVDFHKFNKAINFIRSNISEDAVFMIDGGGSGCTGASASYGERIFPLTSRQIFYFTNYCWAEYNRTEYKNRVDLYREVSINASCCIDEMKDYNITHVFIGEQHVGLDPDYFNNSNYELIYDEDNYKIYEVN